MFLYLMTLRPYSFSHLGIIVEDRQTEAHTHRDVDKRLTTVTHIGVSNYVKIFGLFNPVQKNCIINQSASHHISSVWHARSSAVLENM